MTEPAAILATFSGFKPVMSRKCVQLVFEVPIERFKETLDTLGMPDPGAAAWCGIARIQTVKVEHVTENLAGGAGAKDFPEPQSRSRLNDAPPAKPNSTRAVMMAKDEEFRKFLRFYQSLMPAKTEAEADLAIKYVCNVESKTELNAGAGALAFDKMRNDFLAWRSGRNG
jgi:hypothetical protein